MTVTEYNHRVDQVLRYLGRLLIAPVGSPEWNIGRTLALADDEDRMRYIGSLIEDNPEGSRAHEIGWDIRAIVLNWPESGAA